MATFEGNEFDMSGITEDQVTFLIQGPLVVSGGRQVTKDLMSKLRLQYPRSQLVYSTWLDTPTDAAIGANSSIFICDPGYQQDEKTSAQSNAIRQILGAQAGLKLVTTPYTIKLRSDLVVVGRGMIKVLNARPIQFDSPYRVTEETLMAIDFTSINPWKSSKLLFHPCDWIYGGLTEDLVRVFAVGDLPVSQVCQVKHRGSECWALNSDAFKTRLRPEAQIWISFLQRCGIETTQDSDDFSLELAELSHRIMIQNFMFVSLSQLGLRSLKYPQALMQRGSWHRFFRYKDSYTYYEWRSERKSTSSFRIKFLFSLESALMLLVKVIDKAFTEFALRK